ncbi:FERM domain-containing protein 3-like [Petromyzon marinus]|uniref:FERM domain-containing protein 3-like n=1 Tax=Petromyzon marinus TaxID=7757 RepID=UPI003F6E674A
MAGGFDRKPWLLEWRAGGTARALLLRVCERLGLAENPCLGLRHVDSDKQRHWLDLAKSVAKQITTEPPYRVCFRVRVYPSQPAQILDRGVRSFVYLQLKRDISHARLQCPRADAAWLSACALQAELGDFSPAEHGEDYVSRHWFLPRRSERTERLVATLHTDRLRGQGAEEAEWNFLQRAAGLITYGVDPHPCKDESGERVFLAFIPAGFVVFQGGKRVVLLPWPDVLRFRVQEWRLSVYGIQKEKKVLLEYQAETPQAAVHTWQCATHSQRFYRYEAAREMASGRRLLFFWKSRGRHRAGMDGSQSYQAFPRPPRPEAPPPVPNSVSLQSALHLGALRLRSVASADGLDPRDGLDPTDAGDTDDTDDTDETVAFCTDATDTGAGTADAAETAGTTGTAAAADVSGQAGATHTAGGTDTAGATSGTAVCGTDSADAAGTAERGDADASVIGVASSTDTDVLIREEPSRE